MAMQTGQTLDIAVVGGGIGGLCTAIGLLKHPHLRVQIYEAAHRFSEIGAGVAFGPNAQRALNLIGPDTERAFLNQATHNTWKKHKNTWFEFRYGMGPKEGQVLASPQNETGQATVHRAKFLDEFVSLVPENICHFGKRLVEVEDTKHGVKLHFKDGTSATADCVFGADGVHSVIREHIMGSAHPNLKPVFSGSVAYRGLVPMQQAIDALGEEYAQNSFNLVGDGAMIMTYPIDHGATVNIIAINSRYEKWEGPWVVKADVEKIKSEFADWGSQAQKIIQLLDTPNTAAWSMWDMWPAPKFNLGQTVMLGDAAHATTPFQGQGAGQAIEDAYVLSSLFANVDTTQKADYAFQAYDRIRRPRSQRVVETSREAGELVSMRLPGVGDDAAEFKKNVDWRLDWMWHRDIAGEFEEAKVVFEKLVAGEKLGGME